MSVKQNWVFLGWERTEYSEWNWLSPRLFPVWKFSHLATTFFFPFPSNYVELREWCYVWDSRIHDDSCRRKGMPTYAPWGWLLWRKTSACLVRFSSLSCLWAPNWMEVRRTPLNACQNWLDGEKQRTIQFSESGSCSVTSNSFQPPGVGSLSLLQGIFPNSFFTSAQLSVLFTVEMKLKGFLCAQRFELP